MSNLQSYFEGFIKEKKKKGKKKDKIPRMRRGTGIRHRAYKNYNKSNMRESIDKQLLLLLTALTKAHNIPSEEQAKKQEEQLRGIRPFEERQRQQYSYTFEERPKPQAQPIETQTEPTEEKQLQLASIHNEYVDYEGQWKDILEEQNQMLDVLKDVDKGEMSEEAQEEISRKNQEVKSQIFALQQDLQERINQAQDVNDYKEFINFQNKNLDMGSNNFVIIDNRLREELLEDKLRLKQDAEAQEELKKEFFEEKKLLQEKTDNEILTLKLDLEKSQFKEAELTDLLNQSELKERDLEKQLKKKSKVLETMEEFSPMKTTDIEKIIKERKKQAKKKGQEEAQEEEVKQPTFRPPSPKPKSPKKPSPEELQRQEIGKLNLQQREILRAIKSGTYAAYGYNAVKELFGIDESNRIAKLTKAGAKPQALKELLLKSGVNPIVFEKI